MLGAIILGTLMMLWEPLEQTPGIQAFEMLLTAIYATDVALKGFSMGWMSKKKEEGEEEIEMLASHGLDAHAAMLIKHHAKGFFDDHWNTLDCEWRGRSGAVDG